jgi:Tfp pilus assembly protein PilF
VSFLRLARDADASYQAGDLKAAQKKYELLLKANRTYAAAYVRLGAIAYRQGNLPLAKTHFQRAMGQDPNNAQARYNLAMLSLNEARQLLSEYLRLAAPGPNRERTLVLLSRLNDFEKKP